MLCPACRRQVERDAGWCGSCGASLGGAGAPLDLVVAGAARVPLVSAVTVGRAAGSTVVLSDPAVSRLHVRIAPGNGGGPVLEDAGSAYGTYVDGVRVTGPVPLRDGAKIRLGDSELAVERRRETIIVPVRTPPPSSRWSSTRRSSGCTRACGPATRCAAATRESGRGSSAISSATRTWSSATTTWSCSSSSTARARWPT